MTWNWVGIIFVAAAILFWIVGPIVVNRVEAKLDLKEKDNGTDGQ